MADLVELRLREELELIAPLRDDDRDWADVLGRVRASGGQPSRWSWRRRHRVLVVALALFLLAVGVAVAVDVIGRKNVFFRSSRPAPNIVKKTFLDLGIGAPPQLAPQAIAGQAREVGTFPIHGRKRRLWVAPTRRGGYCYLFEHNSGGCRRDGGELGRRLGVSWMETDPNRRLPIATWIVGDITAPDADRLTVEYADGSSHDIPFVWVSNPIQAGFFVYDIPRSHWRPESRVERVVLRSRSGGVLDKEAFPLRPKLRRPLLSPTGPARQRVLPQLPATPTPPPSAPVQRGSGNGVTVSAGANGSVLFDLRGLDPDRRKAAAAGVGYGCFRLTREFGFFTVRSAGRSGKFGATVGISQAGVTTPFDGCDLQGQYGHRWPDRFGSHSLAEIPLTAKGRAFFADRAAARDLALFIRSSTMHRLRKLNGEQLRETLEATYGERLAHSHIRVRIGAKEASFAEQSPTGKTFTVVIRNGRITPQNLKPYGFVF